MDPLSEKKIRFFKKTRFSEHVSFSLKNSIIVKKAPFYPIVCLKSVGAGFFPGQLLIYENTLKRCFCNENAVLRVGNYQKIRLRRAVRRSGAQSKLAKSYVDP